MSTRLVNSPIASKWLIECEPGQYRVGNVSGAVPPDKDCIIAGWHFKGGKLLKQGTIIFVPGTGNFRTVGNIIEN